MPRGKKTEYFNLPDSLFKDGGYKHIQGVKNPLSEDTLAHLQESKKQQLDRIYPAQSLFMASQELLGESHSMMRKLGEEDSVILEVTRDAPNGLTKLFPGHIWVRIDADFLGYPFDAKNVYLGTDQFSTREPTFADFKLDTEIETDLNGQAVEIADSIRQLVEFAGSSTREQ